MAIKRPQKCKNVEGCSGLCEVCAIYLRDANGLETE